MNKVSLYNNLLKADFSSFIAKVFATNNPSLIYLDNWHIDLLVDALEQVMSGKLTRLIINIPPRSLKSLCINVAWPAWLLGHNPHSRIISASYSKHLSIKHSLDCRNIIQADWYKNIFKDTVISKEQCDQSKFITTKRGFRFATSIGGSLTGEGGDFLIIDDPHHPLQINSSKLRNKVIEWFEQIFVSRLDDKKKGAIVIVMQRLHEQDLCGYLIQKNSNWLVLNIPAIATTNEVIKINKKVYHRQLGEVIHPKRESPKELEIIKAEMGQYAFEAQYQQQPMATLASMIKVDWLRRYSENEVKHTEIFHSWDMAVKTGINNDYSVCTIWSITNNNYYLIEVVRKKLEYPKLRKLVIELTNQYQPTAILIEDKANGSALIQELKSSTSLPVIAIKPTIDKFTRFNTITTYFESGLVFLPKTSDWLAEYEKELFGFPNLAHDDQVDSTSQFFNYLKRRIIINPRINFI